MKHFYQIFADYHQFYLWDKNAAADAPTDYNEEDIRRRIKAAPHVVVIQSARNVEVPVEVEFSLKPPSCTRRHGTTSQKPAWSYRKVY